jgi:hypothetical protein
MKRQMNKCLVVGDNYAEYYRITDPIVLLPSVSVLPPWRIGLNEAHEFAKQNTILTNTLADFAIEHKIFGDTKYSDKGMYQLVRPIIAFLNYILTDRALRAIRLIQSSPGDLVLPAVDDFPPAPKCQELYAFCRDSWAFNQFVVNALLDGCMPVVAFEKALGAAPELYRNHHQNYGFDSKARNTQNPLLTRVFNALTSPRKVLEYVSDNIDKWFPVGDCIPVHSLAYNEKELRRKGFFAPFGRFRDIKDLDIPARAIEPDQAKRNKLGALAGASFVAAYAEFMRHFVDLRSADDRILGNVSRLFFSLVPGSFLECLEQNCNYVSGKFKSFSGGHYLSGRLSGDAAFFSFAAAERNWTIWGIQHSACGGYLSNAALIAEDSIGGCDYYITSGWSNDEPHLPTWRQGPLPLPSPHYSELTRRRRRKRLSTTPARKVLLCLGEVYRFPLVYHALLAADALFHWNNAVKDVVRHLAENKVQTVLKLYSPAVTKTVHAAMDGWRDVGGDFLVISDNSTKGEAQLLFDEADAVFWDIPTGGFVECGVLNKPAFVLWDKNLIAAQPAAAPLVEELLRVGVFCENGATMVHNYLTMYNSSGLVYNDEQARVVNLFLDQYIKRDAGWPGPWKHWVGHSLIEASPRVARTGMETTS